MLYDQIQQAADAVRAEWAKTPRVGIILGAGLGALAQDIATDAGIPYEEIRHFPRSTVESHAGRLVCGTLGGKAVVAMEGRFHAYEGHTLQQVTFPVRVMKALGCDTLIVSNACGGVNPPYPQGGIMIIQDHINLLGPNPLIRPNDDSLGDRFPDMSYPYDRELLKLAKTIAMEEHISVQQGVYVAVTGPNLETRAEYRFLRTIGADVVGMSTVPEVIVAVHSKMRSLGFSAVTDMCLPDALKPVSLPEILAVAAEAEKKLRVLVRRVIERMQ